jgi:hypothetical protein
MNLFPPLITALVVLFISVPLNVVAIPNPQRPPPDGGIDPTIPPGLPVPT